MLCRGSRGGPGALSTSKRLEAIKRELAISESEFKVRIYPKKGENKASLAARVVVIRARFAERIKMLKAFRDAEIEEGTHGDADG